MSFPPAGWNPTRRTWTTVRRCSARFPVHRRPGQPPPVANDTRVVLGKLDQKLYASAEPDNAKAAARLASDMGEFFMPYPGTRVNQETIPLGANGAAGGASYYEVKFSDATKPNGQIWAGVVSAPGPAGAASQRLFVVWLGTGNNPVDKAGAKALAESVRPLAAPPGPAPAPGAPAPGCTCSGTPSRQRRLRHLLQERRRLRLPRRHRPDSPPAATVRHRLRAGCRPSLDVPNMPDRALGSLG